MSPYLWLCGIGGFVAVCASVALMIMSSPPPTPPQTVLPPSQALPTPTPPPQDLFEVAKSLCIAEHTPDGYLHSANDVLVLQACVRAYFAREGISLPK